ncbi:MAG: hypothetical protein ACHQT6_09850, partial [Candidatus Acidiferrales bacterium]
TPASASFNTPTICSSLNRLFLIGASPLVVLYPEKLTYGWTSFRGAGQDKLKYFFSLVPREDLKAANK